MRRWPPSSLESVFGRGGGAIDRYEGGVSNLDLDDKNAAKRTTKGYAIIASVVIGMYNSCEVHTDWMVVLPAGDDVESGGLPDRATHVGRLHASRTICRAAPGPTLLARQAYSCAGDMRAKNQRAEPVHTRAGIERTRRKSRFCCVGGAFRLSYGRYDDGTRGPLVVRSPARVVQIVTRWRA